MNEISCKIKITIKDYYPKLKKIPYTDYNCVFSNNNYKYILPLKRMTLLLYTIYKHLYHKDNKESCQYYTGYSSQNIRLSV